MRKFSTSFNGFDKNEVTTFVNEVTKQYESMLNKLKEQDAKLQILQEKLTHYENMETTLNRAILVAEDASNQIKRIAREESQSIINDAKRNASRILNDALIKAEKVEYEADDLRRKVVNFKRKIRQSIEDQLEMVDNIPEKIDESDRY